MKNKGWYMIIEPEKFIGAFRNAIRPEKDKKGLQSNWKSNPSMTKFLLESKKNKNRVDYKYGFLRHVAEHIGLKNLSCWNEYQKYDMIYYTHSEIDRGIKFDKKNSYRDWFFRESINTVIEVENIFERSVEEMKKLCYFHCPLAVLITYPNDKQDEFLNKYAVICKIADIGKDFKGKYRKLVIFGYTDENDNKKHGFKFYLYNGKKFKKCPKDIELN